MQTRKRGADKEMNEVSIFDVEAQNKKIAVDQKRERQREIDDIREILKKPEGRRFLWRLWSMAGLFREPFSQNSNQTGYNLGRMSLGRDILADVNEADFTAFSRLQQEYVSALKSKKEVKEAKEAQDNA